MKAREMVIARRNTYTQPLLDWTELRVGESVEVFKDAQPVAVGHVEEVSSSGRVLWLLTAGAVHSMHYLKSDGVLVRRTCQVLGTAMNTGLHD